MPTAAPSDTSRVVLITGAAGNLGGAVAAAFAARGDRLALADRSVDALEAARAALPAGTESAAFAADLIAPSGAAGLVADVVDRFGRLDVLVNLAGGFTMGPPIHETPDKDWDFMLDLNARTVFNCARAAVPHLVAFGTGGGGGRIVNVSARAATQGRGHMGPYCVSKAAVITLTETLADELKDLGVNVNCVLPGTLDTPQNRAAMPDGDTSRWVPLPALADVIVFLASDAARAVTGAAVPVYGRG